MSQISCLQEKLKELHQKSLNILQNNLKRKKTQSRETKQSVRSNGVDIKLENENKAATKLPATETLDPNLISKTSTKVSIDEVDAKVENSVPAQKLLSPSSQAVARCLRDSRFWEAAVKIQSCYRKYRLRKLSELNRKESALKNVHFDYVTERQRPGQTNTKSSLSLFEEQIEPYPLNFASTVKRKLDFTALGWLYEFPVEDVPVTRDNYLHVPRDGDDRFSKRSNRSRSPVMVAGAQVLNAESQNNQKDIKFQESNNVRSTVPTSTGKFTIEILI